MLRESHIAIERSALYGQQKGHWAAFAEQVRQYTRLRFPTILGCVVALWVVL